MTLPILLALAATQPATAPADPWAEWCRLRDTPEPWSGPPLIRYSWANGTVATDHGGQAPVAGDELVADGFRWRVTGVTRYAGGEGVWQVVAQVEPGETWGWRTDR